MENEFDEIMKQHSDAELVEILNSALGDYKDSAMESARRKFKSRNLSLQKVQEINDTIEQEKYEQEVEANAPPDEGSKLVAFFFPRFFYFMGSSDSNRELVMYSIYGCLFYGCVFGLFFIIRYYFHWHF